MIQQSFSEWSSDVNCAVEPTTQGIRTVTPMRSILILLQSFGSAGALQNARAELELNHSRQLQAALVARRVGTIDAVSARRTITAPSLPVAA